jgi:hypothetical protein
MPLKINDEELRLANEMTHADFTGSNPNDCLTPNYELIFPEAQVPLIKRRVANFFNHRAHGPYHVLANSYRGKEVSGAFSIVVLDPRDRKNFEEFFGADIRNKRQDAVEKNATILVRRALEGHVYHNYTLEDLTPLIIAHSTGTGRCTAQDLDGLMTEVWAAPALTGTGQKPAVSTRPVL